MRSFVIFLAAVLSLSSSTLSFPFHLRRQTQSCNGAPELCTTLYSAVSSAIGSHDSAFIGPLPQQNQNVRPSQQLERGARMMQVQTHKGRADENIVHMCHTDCFLEDAGPLSDWLLEIRQFMETPGRENDVVTVLLTNPEGIPMSAYDAAFKLSGLDKLVFVPGQNEAVPLNLKSWPTLGTMIQAGKRIVVFIGWSPSPTSFILWYTVLTSKQMLAQIPMRYRISWMNLLTSSRRHLRARTSPTAGSTDPPELQRTGVCTSPTTIRMPRLLPTSWFLTE